MYERVHLHDDLLADSGPTPRGWLMLLRLYSALPKVPADCDDVTHARPALNAEARGNAGACAMLARATCPVDMIATKTGLALGPANAPVGCCRSTVDRSLVPAAPFVLRNVSATVPPIKMHRFAS